MLVLSRKRGEEVVIGQNIRVTILGVAGNRVRLGLSAPVDMAIRRSELLPEQTDAPASVMGAPDDTPPARPAKR